MISSFYLLKIYNDTEPSNISYVHFVMYWDPILW